MRHISARPQKIQLLAPATVTQVALRDAVTAPTVFIADDILPRLAELLCSGVNHE